ncbi:hypothetical protein JR316_0009323 [Psilocybe cubensis]|uniref:Uncharacterized protein n=2 Tax=Psilocybe cubensis TaxID=181762 RepID=A0ACB8GTF5_PSICU|nr:hypothetical protein JR316_0009323 [Psilocybe cubensis]KAH9478861.1 hypothetical protein JR316_0009323 [Psilocybe cubensis]
MSEHFRVIEDMEDEDMMEDGPPDDLYFHPEPGRESLSGDEQWVPGSRKPYQPDPLFYDALSERSSNTPLRERSEEPDLLDTPRPNRILGHGEEPNQLMPLSPTKRMKRTRSTLPGPDFEDRVEAASVEVSPTDSSGQLETLPTVQSLVEASAGPSSDDPMPHRDQLVDPRISHNKRRRKPLKVPQETKIIISNEKLRKQVRTLQHVVQTTEAGEVLKVRQEKAILQLGLQKATTLISSQADRTADVSSERDDFEVKYNTAEVGPISLFAIHIFILHAPQKSEREAVESELTAVCNNVQNLLAETGSKDQIIFDLNATVTSKTEEISKLNEMVQAKDKDLSDLRAALDSKDVELRKLKSDMDSAEAHKKQSEVVISDLRKVEEQLQEANRQIQLLKDTMEANIAYKNELDQMRYNLESDRQIFQEDLLTHLDVLEKHRISEERLESLTEEAKKAIETSKEEISKAKTMEEKASAAMLKADRNLKVASQDLEQARKLRSTSEEMKTTTETLKAEVLTEKASVELLKRSAKDSLEQAKRLKEDASTEMKKANRLREHYTNSIKNLDRLIEEASNEVENAHNNCSGFQRASQEASAQIAELKAKLKIAEIKLQAMAVPVDASKGKDKAPTTTAPTNVASVNTGQDKEMQSSNIPTTAVDHVNSGKGKEKASTSTATVVDDHDSSIPNRTDGRKADHDTQRMVEEQSQIRQSWLSKFKSIKPSVIFGRANAQAGSSGTQPGDEDEDDPMARWNAKISQDDNGENVNRLNSTHRVNQKGTLKGKAKHSTIAPDFPVGSGKELQIEENEDQEMLDTLPAEGGGDDGDGDGDGDDENDQEEEGEEEDKEIEEEVNEDEEERAVTNILTRTGSASTLGGQYSRDASRSFVMGGKNGSKREKIDLEKDNKEVRKQYFALVRSVVNDKFGVERDPEFVNHIPPSPGDIMQFETTKRPEDGPKIADLRIDMKGEISSDWNKELVSILVTFATNRKVSQFPDLPHRPQDYLAQMFFQTLERARTFWRDNQPQATDLGKIETSAKREARVEAKRKKEEKRNRKNSRCSIKYSERLFTVKRMIAESEKRDDTAMFNLWSRLLSLLEALEEDGMSSEDSEADDDGDTVYHVRQMPYRRSVDKHMAIIDAETKRYKRTIATQGSNKSRRIRGEDIFSLRRPFVGKPRPLYAPPWLKQQTRTTINSLKIPEKHPFKFFEIKVPDPSA